MKNKNEKEECLICNEVDGIQSDLDMALKEYNDGNYDDVIERLGAAWRNTFDLYTGMLESHTDTMEKNLPERCADGLIKSMKSINNTEDMVMGDAPIDYFNMFFESLGTIKTMLECSDSDYKKTVEMAISLIDALMLSVAEKELIDIIKDAQKQDEES